MSEGGERGHLPFLQPLHALGVQLLHGDHHPHAALGRVQGLLLNAPLVHPPESAFSENHLRLEVPGGGPQLGEGKDPEVGRLQDPAIEKHLINARAAAAGGLPEGAAAAGAR